MRKQNCILAAALAAAMASGITGCAGKELEYTLVLLGQMYYTM